MEDLLRAMQLVVAAGGRDERVLSLRIDGEPIAKARARVNRHRHYTPSRTTDAERDIAEAILTREPTRFDGNVALAAIFYRSNRHRIDTDNLLKTVLDGITRSKAIWPDDSHVTALIGVTELDAENPRTIIAIAPHESTLTRGADAMTHVCETCSQRYRPHGVRDNSRFCSRACRTRAPLTCPDCGGPRSTPRTIRCNTCRRAAQRQAA